MKIKFIANTGGIGFAYMEGQEIITSDGFGMEMIERGMAVLVSQNSVNLPDDFPGRKILIDNGFETLEEVGKIFDIERLTEIRGIGKKLAEQIIAYPSK